MESENYRTLLEADKATLSQLEKEIQDLKREEEERLQRSKMRRMNYNLDRSSDVKPGKARQSSHGDFIITGKGALGPACSHDDDDDVAEQDAEVADEDLKKELRKQQTKIEESKLYVAIQGLRAKYLASNAGDTGKEIITKEELLAMDYGGSTFHRGRCYHFESGNMNVIDGVVKFAPAKNATEIVLVMPFSDTFLGMQESGAIFEWSKYVQVEQCFDLVHLGDLGGESKHPQFIPDEVYKPQVDGDWRHFAYYSKKKPSRCGQRTGDSRRTTLDLFCGAGVMSWGLHNAGYESVCAIDRDQCAAKAFKKNFPCSKVIHGDVSKFLDDCETSKKERESLGKIHLIHASSPCQDFSGANVEGAKDQERNKLCLEIVRAAGIFRPLIATFENVIGMWTGENEHYIRSIVSGLLKLGYYVRCCELNSSEFGDPQARPRLFIIAVKDCAELPPRPVAKHGKSPLLAIVNVEDALEECLPIKRSKSTTLVPAAPALSKAFQPEPFGQAVLPPFTTSSTASLQWTR